MERQMCLFCPRPGQESPGCKEGMKAGSRGQSTSPTGCLLLPAGITVFMLGLNALQADARRKITLGRKELSGGDPEGPR